MSGILSTAHYLLYWKITPEDRLAIAQAARVVKYVGSNQLQKVKPGDVLWLVNVYLGRLFLIGRMQVEVVVDDMEIAQELVGSWPGNWEEADWYAIANRYHTEPLREVELTAVAPALRFNSAHDRLFPVAGRVDSNQLRSLRELTPAAARLLEEVWYDDEYTPATIQDYLELSEDDAAYAEGRTIVRTLRQRQRSRALVLDAKTRFKQAHGHLYCEVCGFDFAVTYGVEYIEAHHRTQMASLDEAKMSAIEDLTMLCANCHRMAHQRTPPYTPDELRHMLKHSKR